MAEIKTELIESNVNVPRRDNVYFIEHVDVGAGPSHGPSYRGLKPGATIVCSLWDL